MQSSAGTLAAFLPGALHGTTLTGGAINYGISITSTRRVNEAYAELEAKGQHVAFACVTDTHNNQLPE